MDLKKIEYAIRLLIEALGYDLNDDHLRDTPKRVALMWKEFMAAKETKINFPTWFAQSDMIIVKNIDFYSFCPHHILPWYGTVNIAYIPDGNIVGLSKLVRATKKVLADLIIQEDATERIADEIVNITRSENVLVIIKATHLCMILRGAKTKANIITVASRGIFKRNKDLRQEALQLIMQL